MKQENTLSGRLTLGNYFKRIPQSIKCQFCFCVCLCACACDAQLSFFFSPLVDLTLQILLCQMYCFVQYFTFMFLHLNTVEVFHLICTLVVSAYLYLHLITLVDKKLSSGTDIQDEVQSHQLYNMFCVLGNHSVKTKCPLPVREYR